MGELKKYYTRRIKMKRLEVITSCVLFLILTIVSSHSLIASPGVIIHHDWVIPPYRELIIQDFPTEFFSAWQSGVDITINSKGGWILGLVNRLLSLILGINGENLSKAYFVFTLWFSGFVMYCVGRAFRKSRLLSVFAGLFYMFSPWLFDRIVAGDFSRMFAYVLYPLCFYFFSKSIISNEDKNGDILYSLLIGILLSFVDNVAFIVIFSSLILYSIIRVICSDKRKKEISINTKSLVIIFCIFLVSNLYWIIPSLLLPQQAGLVSLATVSDLIARSRNAQIINVIRCIGSPMGWFSDSVSKDGILYPIWIAFSFLIPIIAFSVSIFRPKDKNVIFFSLLAIISLFLGKGANPPLGQVYLWAYQNILYFQVFRDPNKWVMTISLAYAFLLLESTELITTIAPRVTWRPSTEIKTFSRVNRRKACSIFLTLMLLSTIFVFSYPFLTGNFGDILKTVDFPRSYQTVTQWLAEQSGDFRVLWLPPDSYTQYDWIGSSYGQRDLIAAYSPKPNLMIYSSSEIGRFSYFLASALYHNTTRYLGEILAIANVKYILLRNDAEGWWWRNFGWTREKLSYIIRNQLGLSLIKKVGMIDVYENQYYEPYQRISATNDITLISGGLSSLTSLTYLKNILNSSLLFVDHIPLNSLQVYTKYANSIIIKDGDFLSFVFGFVQEEYIIELSKYATEGDETKGWATLYASDYWWHHRYYPDSVVESAITSTNATLNVPFSSKQDGRYEIWIKSFWNPRISPIVIIDDTKIGEINSEMFNSLGYSWVKVNSTFLLPGSHLISIQSSGSIKDEFFSEILVSKIAIVPEEVMEKAMINAINVANDKNILFILEAEKTRLDRAENFWVLNGSFDLDASQGLATTSKAYSFMSYDIFVPKSDSYEVSLRANSPQASKVDVSVDDNAIHSLFLDTSTDFQWFNVTTLHLSSGRHVVRLASDSGVSVDLLVLKSLDYQKDTNSTIGGISYHEINPTKYEVHTELQGPYFLFFSEPYSNGWKASVNGIKIDSVPTCSGFNSFFVNETMKTELIIIEFEKQTYFGLGFFVYLIVFSAIVILCVFEVLRRRFLKNEHLLRRFR